MSDEFLVAAIGGAAAIAGGLLTGFFDGVYRWWFRPKLDLSFEDQNDAFVLEGTYDPGGGVRTSKHVRVCLINTGKSIARECRVYLTEISEVDGTQTHPTKLYDAKELPWAGYPKSYSPRHVASGIKFFVDVVRFSQNDPHWNWYIEHIFASQQSIISHKGKFRLTLVATADNAIPSTIQFYITYRGDYESVRTSK